MNWNLLLNSLVVAVASTLGALAAGFLAALCAWTASSRTRATVLGLAVITLALPPFLVVNSWLDLFGRTGGWRRFLPFDVYSLGGVIGLLILLTWPVTLLLVWGVWARLQPSQIESEPLLRGNALLRGLLIPMARDGLGAAAVLTFALALNNFAIPAILQVKVYPAELWVSYSTQLAAGEALALSWPLLLVPIALWLWLSRRELAWPRLEGGLPPGLLRHRLGGPWRVLCAGTTLFVLLFSLAVPLGQLLCSSRTWLELPEAVSAGQRALGQSFLTSAVTATMVTVFAVFTWTRPLGTLAWALFFVPGVLLGIGLIIALNRPLLEIALQGTGAALLGMFLRYLAPGWNVIAQALRGQDRDLAEVARLHGVRGAALWRRVLWPMVGARLAAAWYVTYLLCLWDVETLVLLVPPGGETLALRAFNLLHYGHASQVNALCLTLLLLALAPLLAWGGWHLVRPRFAPGIALAPAGCVLLLMAVPGCRPAPEGVAEVDSRLFGRVRIIGERGTGPGQFNKPRSLATDAQDNLYVVDMTGRVQKFSAEGTFLLSWQMPQTDLGKPKGMARDAAGNIVVAEPHYARVNHFDPAGRLQFRWGNQGTNDGQLAFPRSVAVNRQGELWVSEYSKVERVQRFSQDGRQFLARVGRPGDGPGEFARAEGVGVDNQDRLYVADSCNHRVQVFGSDGRFLRSYGRAGSGRGELSYPYDICVDAAGRQYVCEFGNSRIQVFDASDQPLEILGGPGREPGRFGNPWAITFDSRGALYVADAMNHRVQKFIPREGPP